MHTFDPVGLVAVANKQPNKVLPIWLIIRTRRPLGIFRRLQIKERSSSRD
jgi:hypothetical protein